MEARTALANRTARGRREAETIFQRDVELAFAGWDEVYAALLPERHPEVALDFNAEWRALRQRLNTSHGVVIGHHLCELMVRWFYQFEHFARVEALSRVYGPFQLLVRARLDVMLSRPLVLSSIAGLTRGDGPSQVLHLHALGFSAAQGQPWAFQLENCTGGEEASCKLFFHDWLYVGKPAAMSALAQMTQRRTPPSRLLLVDPKVRCFGWCQEQQVMLQLRLVNVSLTPLEGMHATAHPLPEGVRLRTRSPVPFYDLSPAKGCSTACPGVPRCVRHGIDHSYELLPAAADLKGISPTR